jgi:hypothetical protein
MEGRVSLEQFREAENLLSLNPSLEALIMAAIGKAGYKAILELDFEPIVALQTAFPEIYDEALSWIKKREAALEERN